MTNQSVIEMLSTDPEVTRTRLIQEPGALQPRPLTRRELENLAKTAISVAVDRLFSDPIVRRNYLAKSGGLTLVAGTSVYSLDPSVVEVLDITIGSDGRPLKKFALEVDWNQWAFEQGRSIGQNLQASITTDPAIAFHRASRGENGRFRIRIRPGVSTDDAGEATVWYITSIGSEPYEIDVLPEECHTMCYNTARGIMLGQPPEGASAASLSVLQRTADLVKGAVSTVLHDERMEELFQERNSAYTSEF